MKIDWSKSLEIIGEENQIKAVMKNGYDIKYCHNPSEAVQLEAVKQSGNALQYIHNPSEAVQLEAVRSYGGALRFCHNPSVAVQKEALKSDPDAIQYFKRAWPRRKIRVIPIEEVKDIIEDILGVEVEIVNTKENA